MSTARSQGSSLVLGRCLTRLLDEDKERPTGARADPRAGGRVTRIISSTDGGDTMQQESARKILAASFTTPDGGSRGAGALGGALHDKIGNTAVLYVRPDGK